MLSKITLIILSATIILCCSKKENANEYAGQSETTNSGEVVQELPAVCIWDKGSVRQAPNKDGKWLSSMSLGEKVTFMGISAIDSSDKNVEYYKIKLSDGKEGWASQYVVEIDASPAVILKETPLYRRPDYLTVTDKKLQAMNVVAIKNTEDNWIEVVGEKKYTHGWIQNESISKKDIDIAVGLLASKALSEDDDNVKKEKINEIINNKAFANSVFIEKLKGMVKENPEIMTTEIKKTEKAPEKQMSKSMEEMEKKPIKKVEPKESTKQSSQKKKNF